MSPELKEISGSEKRKPKVNPIGAPRSQLKSITPLTALPPIPLWIARNASARKEYLEVGPLLVEAGLLTRANIQLFCASCIAIGLVIEGVEADPMKKASLNQSLLVQHRNILSEFGLTPTSQIRRGGPEEPKAPEKPAENPFEANKRKAA